MLQGKSFVFLIVTLVIFFSSFFFLYFLVWIQFSTHWIPRSQYNLLQTLVTNSNDAHLCSSGIYHVYTDSDAQAQWRHRYSISGFRTSVTLAFPNGGFNGCLLVAASYIMMSTVNFMNSFRANMKLISAFRRWQQMKCLGYLCVKCRLASNHACAEDYG
jgi:hypothetical protein